ncbi:MAG: hypothetical protein Tsb0016_27880 [Sphingomonadales bacterium]
MTPRSRAIFGWELVGAAFIVITGSSLHFVFDWLGGWRPVALIAAVNESIWEHLKLAFWPGLLWAVLGNNRLALSLPERLAGKGFGLLVAAALIVAIFRGYTAILGDNLLVLDIGTFVLAVVLGQMIAAACSIWERTAPVLTKLGLALLALQLVAYAVFTFHPPDFWLFVDGRTGLVGIPPR